MKLRVLAAIASVPMAFLAAGIPAGCASPTGGSSASPGEPLRALAAQIGLRVGTAVTPYDLDPSHAAYYDIVASQFSVLTPENAMKWQLVEPTEGTYDWSGGDQVVAFAKEHGDLVRGHTLLYHNQLPTWLTQGVADGSISNAQLLDLLHQHITTEVTHFRGEIWQWDVANEFFADPSDSCILPDGISCSDWWVQHLGEGIIADAYDWAHAADPNALLFYNDYNIAGEDGTNAKFHAVYAWLQKMLAEGVPIDGVSDQGHMDMQYPFPTEMTQDLQQYASLGLKVAITEADVRTLVNDAKDQQPTDPAAPQTQAGYYSQMLQACLAVHSCISFTVWGFDDSESWVPSYFPGEGYADIYDVKLTPKPSYSALQEDLEVAARSAPHPSAS